MGPLGTEEIVAIFVLALLLFGPKELPKLGKTIGKALAEFRRAQSELKSTFDREMRNIEREANLKELKELTSTAYQANSYNYDNSSYDASYYEGSYESNVAAEPVNGTSGEHGTSAEHEGDPAAPLQIEAATGTIPAGEQNGHGDHATIPTSATVSSSSNGHNHSSPEETAG